MRLEETPQKKKIASESTVDVANGMVNTELNPRAIDIATKAGWRGIKIMQDKGGSICQVQIQGASREEHKEVVDIVMAELKKGVTFEDARYLMTVQKKKLIKKVKERSTDGQDIGATALDA